MSSISKSPEPHHSMRRVQHPFTEGGDTDAYIFIFMISAPYRKMSPDYLCSLMQRFQQHTHKVWYSYTFKLAWDGHFSFAGETIVHRPCVWRPPCDLLHDLSLLHPLQLWHVGHDASAAGLETLCRLQCLVFLGAGGQQLAGAITHPDFMVDLLLDVTVL